MAFVLASVDAKTAQARPGNSSSTVTLAISVNAQTDATVPQRSLFGASSNLVSHVSRTTILQSSYAVSSE
jgi:hypothetical protein